MDNSGQGHIEPGAAVVGADGLLGRIARVEFDTIEVALDPNGQQLFIPRQLIRRVRDDGSVELSTRRAELLRLTSGGAAGPRADRQQVETVELREERLVPHTELEEAGRVRIRKAVEDLPQRIEVDAYVEEVTVEHVPVGRIVSEQEPAREEHGVYIVPIYEEQLVVVKRLLLKEEVRIHRRGASEKRFFEDTVRHERLVVDDLDRTGRVREHYPTEGPEGAYAADDPAPSYTVAAEEPGVPERLGRKALS